MKNIRRIIQLSKPLYRLIIFLSALVLVMSVVQQMQPFLVKFVVDNIEKQITTGTGNLNQIGWLIFAMLALNLLAGLLDSLNMRLGDFVSSRLGKFLTEQFYQKVFTLPQKYFDTEVSGKIINQLNRGILSIQDFMGMMTNFVLPALYQSVFTIAILTYYSPAIGLIAFTIFPVYILISHYSTKLWGKSEIKKNRLEDDTRGRIQEVIGNIRLVRGFLAQKHEWHLVSDTLAKINHIYDHQSTVYHLINFSREFGLEVALILISLIVFRSTFKGTFTIGEMVLILQLLNQLRRPLFAMSFILERIQRAETGSKEYFDIMGLESTESFSRLPESPSRQFNNPSLIFKNVSFRYDAQTPMVLKNLNLSIPGKRTVALVGHSGAGKTTIINLILKFYEPTEGEIYLNDVPYTKLSHEQIRNHISLVFQDNELFSTTIRENVAYGLSAVTDQAIKLALKKANALDFVMALPDGLDAKIGERGIKLSGGQKQRIQIARAIIHNSPILILDEATSSLDSQSEKAVQQALNVLMQDKLVIIIAHRFSTIQNADQILVIDQGKCVAAGTPEALAKKPGMYQKLLRYQIEGNQKLLQKFELQ